MVLTRSQGSLHGLQRLPISRLRETANAIHTRQAQRSAPVCPSSTCVQTPSMRQTRAVQSSLPLTTLPSGRTTTARTCGPETVCGHQDSHGCRIKNPTCRHTPVPRRAEREGRGGARRVGVASERSLADAIRHTPDAQLSVRGAADYAPISDVRHRTHCRAPPVPCRAIAARLGLPRGRAAGDGQDEFLCSAGPEATSVVA